MKKVFIIAVVLFALLPIQVQAGGYLAGKAHRLSDLVFGTDEAGYQVSQHTYDLETGKSYRLKIISSGRKEYAVKAADFFNFIWLRKVEAGGIEIKTTSLYELEFEEEGEAEIFFVPIKPGTYTISAAGLEHKGTSVKVEVK